MKHSRVLMKDSDFAKQISQARQEKRICYLPYDENAKTFSAWDIGIGDSCAIWVFQLVGKEIHVIDYYENSDEAQRTIQNGLNPSPTSSSGITFHMMRPLERKVPASHSQI